MLDIKNTHLEIAFELNYSSAQYLSNQFKQVTGLRPSKYRNMLESDRKQLDKV
ncbi:MAG: AraC family transcriptional regulator [Flavobacteriales bacterium]|nr:AraC family transcriptional regulator [Flavobacteriales bacterium]